RESGAPSKRQRLLGRPVKPGDDDGGICARVQQRRTPHGYRLHRSRQHGLSDGPPPGRGGTQAHRLRHLGADDVAPHVARRGGAEKGTVAVMYAGPRAGFDELKSMLSAIGKPFFIGEKPGMGQTMKLCNNLLSAANMALSAEIMVMGAKSGLDPAIMVDVINVSSGLNTAVRDKFPKSVMPGTFDYGFYTGLMYKDVRLCVEEGEALGVPMPLAGAVHQM